MVIVQANGAATNVLAYVSDIDGAVVVEIDTDTRFDGNTQVRVYVNDSVAWEETL